MEQTGTESNSPPPMSTISINEDVFSPLSPPYVPHHQRNHSFSSTSSAGHFIMNPKRDTAPILGTSVPNDNADSAADSAYGGSTNHLYTEINKPFFNSAPSVSSL